ncbi:MAG: hypothetical protein ACR2GX_09775 [Candidatus Dormibacteria bacterium]
MTPLGVVLRGALAGAAGTAAMDLALYLRHRAAGGSASPLAFEFGGSSDWESVPAPAQVGRRLYEGLRQRPLDARRARLTNNIVHWGYGIAWGSAFGIVGGSLRSHRVVLGPVWGATVWASSYVTLPLAGLYKPVWKYPISELAPDLGMHLVFGTTVERVFSALS